MNPGHEIWFKVFLRQMFQIKIFFSENLHANLLAHGTIIDQRPSWAICNSFAAR